jgi:hypothetical protein
MAGARHTFRLGRCLHDDLVAIAKRMVERLELSDTAGVRPFPLDGGADCGERWHATLGPLGHEDEMQPEG